MITVKFSGGLGNQMFQYAFGLYLSEKKNEVSYFFLDMHNQDVSKLAINCFDTNAELISGVELHNCRYYSSNYFLYRLKRKFLQQFPFFSKKVFVEKSMNYLSNIHNDYSTYDGYWQSYKYIEPIELKLRESFKFVNAKLYDNELYNEIHSNSSVSLHIRRGDYLVGNNISIFESCSIEYYQNAISFLSKRLVSSVFYVFSNDIEWAQEYLKLSEEINLKFVDNSANINPTFVDLFFMSSCKHQIIANSTFSWWGAWLNPSKEKIVIAPAKWYKGDLNKSTIDLIPPSWIRL